MTDSLPPGDLELLFEASPEVLVVLLPDRPRYTMVAATKARLEATKRTRGQTLGHGFFEVFPDNPNDPASPSKKLRASLDRVIASRAPDTMPVTRGDVRDAEGNFVAKYWSPRNVPVLSPSGEVKYILHRVQDVTDLVHAAEVGEELRGKTREMERDVIERSLELAVANDRLRETNEKLGELDAAKTAFFSNVSHEFRTPLTLILGPVEDALARGGAIEGDALRAVHRSSLRLLRLVNSLLDFSRVEAGRGIATFEPTDLAELTAGLASSFRSLVEGAGLELVVDCPPLPAPVYVDREAWEKIVLNLVSNAFKFTFKGAIAVRMRAKEGNVELVVSDTGTGIPEREHARIFERFHRVEGAHGRSFEGTGIGLALVQELVKAHGGAVRLESAMGRGSAFHVTIPTGTAHLPGGRITARPPAAGTAGSASYLLEASQWTREATSHTRPALTDVAAKAKRVLVADDNSDVRAYLEHLLSPYWAVQVVSDGAAALAAAHESPPDLILTDAMMPKLDGFGLLRALRASPKTRTIPVILLSARAGEEAVVEGLETGADDYLVKPFSARELLTRVRARLDAATAKTSALRASETRFRRLAESGIIGIVIVDASGRVVEANDTFLAMVAHPREDLIAGALEWAKLAPPAEPDPTSDGPRDVTPATRPTERRLRRRDGAELPALVAVAPLEGGETIAVCLDLTERKRLEAQIRQAQKMEAVGRLAGGIAHDFNNLLSVILSYTELRMPELEARDALRADLGEIRTAGLRAAELTKQLLAFSRQQVLAMRVLDLNESISAVVKMLRRLLGADIELVTFAGRNLGRIKADPGQIEQVVMNLAVNARDAMPNGGKLTIETTNMDLDADFARAHHEVRAGAYVMLSVADTGVGIDAATQARVFEPFFTTKEPGKGTGLGLATVFGIVKQSGGHIVLYSELGKGTVFRLYFPRVESESDAPASDRLSPDSRPGNETILLVEDDEQLRVLTRGILKRSGYTVIDAPNGGEALLASDQHPGRVHLLLTDVVLPRMSGVQLAERLAQRRPEMKVVFMSGYTGDAVVERGVLVSRVAYLQKPITPGTLTRKVREVLRSGGLG
jgi:PAS domain S-box-containing protein